jgi:urocanate hydratase
VWREGRWWVAEVAGVGATQARALPDLRRRAVDLVATSVDCEPEEVEVHLSVQLPVEVADELARAAALRAQALDAQHEAALAVRRAASRLHEEGVSVRDIGTALGVSYQRAHQLVNGR